MLMLLQELESLFKSIGWSNYDYNETINNISIARKCNKHECMNICEYDFNKIFSIFGESFTMKLRSEYSDVNPIIKMKSYVKKDLNEDVRIITDVSPDDSINVEILIDKIKLIQIIFNNYEITDHYNIKLFASINGFLNYVKEKTYNQLENNLFSSNKKTIILIIKDNVLLKNDFTLIIGGKPINDIIQYIRYYFVAIFDKASIGKKIEMRNENCNWLNGTKWLLPDNLYFDFDNNNFCFPLCLQNYILKITADILIPFLANYTSKDEEGLFSNINGYKKIKVIFKKDIQYKNNEIKYLYKIYQWIYNGNNTDKLSIFRNISSIFLCEECSNSYYELLLSGSHEIYNSVLSNFDTYLKKNVEQYFEERHKAREIISNKCKDIASQINFIIETMNKNFLTTIGLIIVSILGYLARENIYILKISAIIYGIFLVINNLYYLPFYKFRLSIIDRDYKEHVEVFSKILLKKDIPNDKMIFDIKKKFNIYWWCSLVISILLIFVTVYSAIYTDKIVYYIKKYIK